MLYFPKLLLNLEFYVEMYLEFKNFLKLIYCRKWVLNISPVTLLWFQPVIKKEKPEVGKWGGNSLPLFYPLPTPLSCVYSDCNFLIH